MTPNNNKILMVLKDVNEPINTTLLAEKTGIDIRNITRYIKALEGEGKVIRKTIQNGQLRSVLISLAPTQVEKPKPHPPIAPKLETLHRPVPAVITPENTSFKIDWNKVAQSSDFKRAVYLALEGKSWRGTDAKLEEHLNTKIEVFREPNAMELIKELKTHFANGLVKPSQIK